jgi:aldehyde:ferredoxin oxidoreductase
MDYPMAGESLIHIAAIMNDGQRAMAGGGPSAVMGSKNLKAIVVEGNGKMEIADQGQYKLSAMKRAS